MNTSVLAVRVRVLIDHDKESWMDLFGGEGRGTHWGGSAIRTSKYFMYFCSTIHLLSNLSGSRYQGATNDAAGGAGGCGGGGGVGIESCPSILPGRMCIYAPWSLFCRGRCETVVYP